MRYATWQEAGIEPGVRIKANGEFASLCPQCSEQRSNKTEKCLKGNMDSGLFNCKNCGWTGAIGGRPSGKAPVVYTQPEPVRDRPLDMSTYEWLVVERGIKPEVISRLELYGDAHDIVSFPIKKNGQLIRTKHRHPDRKAGMWVLPSDADPTPYGWDDCIGQSEVVIVEGEMDKLAIESATGWKNVLVIPGATPGDDVIGLVGECVREAKRIYLAGDADDPGEKMMANLAPRLGYSRCQRVHWPQECKDANDTLMQLGAQFVLDALTTAQPFPVEGIIEVGDIYDSVDALYERGMPGGYECGVPEVDAKITLRKSGLTVVTGAPGAGKTVWVDWYLVQQARNNGLRVALCSTEMVPPERHVALLISQYIDKPFAAYERDRMTVKEMQAARQWVGNHFYFILPEENTVDAILERARVLKERHDIDVLVIDPFNDIFSTRNREQTNTDWIHGVLSQMSHAATDLGMHIIVVAHPKKLGKKMDGTYFVPTLYDIAESAGFANRCTNGLALWRDTTLPEKECVTQVHVQKIKFHEDGEVGVIQFGHRKATGNYWPVETVAKPSFKERINYSERSYFDENG